MRNPRNVELKALFHPSHPLRAAMAAMLCGVLLAGAVIAGQAHAAEAAREPAKATEKPAGKGAGKNEDTFDQDTVMRDAKKFFGDSAEGLATVIEKAFKEHGRPNAYIAGEEASGAIGVGLRYGNGQLRMKSGGARTVYWQGPSIGFDWGGNASKVFVLIYHLPNTDALFQRFPSVDGSFYYVGGVGINYQRRDNITLAPIRLGVGLRAGASIGYMHYSRAKTYNPF
jgi:hypothetical protein